MKSFFFLIFLSAAFHTHSQTQLNADVALSLSRLPLHCISVEFPNKTSHLADGPKDARLLPSELHPVFYGCLDWHSSVHGHWLLVQLLDKYPNIPNRDSIIRQLNISFDKNRMQQEAEYFGKYTASTAYERTYGWAWLLKLDEMLVKSTLPEAKKWHAAMQPLTKKILSLWIAYLPKQTYPNRTGVHPNTAFGLGFAYDWAVAVNDTAFKRMIVDKAKYFYLDNQQMPGYLEPDGSDFFSPSLMAADLMTRVLNRKEFNDWFKNYYNAQSFDKLCSLPKVSDRSDYQIVHLDGLSFSRAWCMKNIAQHLDQDNPTKKRFEESAQQFLDATVPQIFSGYGGEHWLASFALYALMTD